MTVLALVGPTAAGKSALALEIARRRQGRRRPVEIVAIDAFTLYRGMDLATAKPSRAVRAEVAHHLIDVLDPWVEVSVKWFQQEAREAIAAIVTRGATPLLVGGSGLYFRATVDDLRFPPTDRRVRRGLELRYVDDPEAAWRLLQRRDPEAASRIDPANLRRTIRALEVIELTGELFSSYATAWERYDSIYPDLEVGYVDDAGPRLRDAIAQRARAMVAAGLLEEARRLRALGRPLSRTAQQAIGYAEAFAVLDGRLPSEQLATAIADRTWRFARRQRRWFRRDPRCIPRVPQELLARWA